MTNLEYLIIESRAFADSIGGTALFSKYNTVIRVPKITFGKDEWTKRVQEIAFNVDAQLEIKLDAYVIRTKNLWWKTDAFSEHKGIHE